MSGISNASGSGTDDPNETLTDTISSVVNVTYVYTVSANGCVNPAAFSVVVPVTPLPALSSTLSPSAICSGTVFNYIPASGTAGASFTWTRAIITGISNSASSGAGNLAETLIDSTASAVNVTYVYTITVNGCSNLQNIVIALNPIPIAITNSNSPVCAGSSITLTAQTILGGTYLWTGPNGYSSSFQDSVIIFASNTNAGIYSLTVSANGCASVPATVSIVVNNCSTDLSVVKTVNNTHPFIGSSVVFTITATNIGTYDATGVTVTDILQSGYTYVSSTATAGTYDHSTGVWTIGSMNNGAAESLTITVIVNSTGIYVNTALLYSNGIDTNMVNNISSIETVPTDFFIPDGFSPNGDGINDVFEIRGIENYPDNIFVIFNRWGNRVFEANPYQNTWDGKSTTGIRIGGDELPVSTYFYLLDLGNGSAVIKGTIYLNK